MRAKIDICPLYSVSDRFGRGSARSRCANSDRRTAANSISIRSPRRRGRAERRRDKGAGWEIKYPSECTGTKATPARWHSASPKGKAMISVREDRAAAVSRRSLLQGAVGVGSAVAVLCLTTYQAAAKMGQQAVGYQDTPKGPQQCDGCALFEAPNACKTVDGVISPKGWCKIFAKKP